MPQNYLAFDLGASSGRAVLGAWDGERLRLEEVHRFENRPVRMLGRLHWNLPGLLDEMRVALGTCASSQTVLSGVSVDSWGVDFALLGHDGSLLGLPVHYRDRRTEGVMQRTFEIASREEIFARTGLQFLPFNTLYQLMAMKLAGSTQLEHAGSLVMIADLLAMMLCEGATPGPGDSHPPAGVRIGIRPSRGSRKPFCEFTLASTTQMLDPIGREWSYDLLRMLGLRADVLPGLVEPCTLVGELEGFAGVPVIAGASHDTACAVAAVPAEADDRWAYISSGTWSLMGMELDAPLVNEDVLQAGFTNEGGIDRTWRFLKNIAGLWPVQECRRAWSAAGEDLDFAAMTAMASRGAPFGAIIDPDDPSLLAPGNMPEAIRALCKRTGQPVPERREDLLRAALEGLALKYRDVLERLRRVTGREVTVLHVVGGGVRNELLAQFAADACGVPVVAGPVEATACGNILAQLVASRELSTLAQARQVVRASFETKTYEPRDVDAWEEAYARYRVLWSHGD